jgi:hypothetical protein
VNRGVVESIARGRNTVALRVRRDSGGVVWVGLRRTVLEIELGDSLSWGESGAGEWSSGGARESIEILCVAPNEPRLDETGRIQWARR